MRQQSETRPKIKCRAAYNDKTKQDIQQNKRKHNDGGFGRLGKIT